MRSPGEAFPDHALPDLEGRRVPLSAAWSRGPALILVGHGDCKTTRETLPYVDRIQRRSGKAGSVVAVLQDDAEAARVLVGDLGLELPVRLDGEPYPLARELGLATVPTLALVGREGIILRVSEGFRRDDLEGLAAALGVDPPLFAPEDRAPALRPG